MILEFSKQKILILVAHPDDEVIFGWPVLQQSSMKKVIVSCSSDANNPTRKWCAHRKNGLFEIAKLVNAECFCFDYDSEFYRMETRGGSLAKMMNDIKLKIEEINPDIIFTHNSFGEYGHLDHQLVYIMAMQMKFPVLNTDIFLQSNWWPYKEIGGLNRMLNKGELVGHFSNNIDFYTQCEKIYRDINVWTWNQPPVMDCNLYLLKE